MISYALSVTFQLFKPCFIGELIESGSDEFSRIAYAGDWIDRDRSYKKSLLISIENIKNPLRINMLKIFNFNLESFVNVSLLMNKLY